MSAALASCGGQSDPALVTPAATSAETSALTVTGDAAVLGFENPALWTAPSAALSSTGVRTQGLAALAVTNPRHVDIVSAKVSSSAPALAGAADPGASFAIDVLVPGAPGKDKDGDPGSLQLLVSCPSRKLGQAELRTVSFSPAQVGTFQTLRYAMNDRLKDALAAGCSDLSFMLRLHAPGRSAGTFVFDNLRVHSPAVMPPQSGSSVDLLARLAYSPSLSTPGSATFPVGVVQVPQSFHVKLGSAGTGSALLELGFGSTVTTSCTYKGSLGGTFYVFSSCTGPSKPGDLVSADFAHLTILSGDSSAGLTKVAAQLALNPVGDSIGVGVIPPMPTWWGDTPAQANQIVTAYFNLVNAAPKHEERWIETPVPDFARRHGDGTPYDTTTGPPPPNDPPFHQSGHLNAGSSTWDAWWQLDGSLSGSANSVAETTTHFDATLGAYALVWGQTIEIAKAVTAFDSGQATTGNLDLYLFTVKLPLGGSIDPNLALDYSLKKDDTFDLPAIHIWIFSITIGLNAGVSLDATGSLSPTLMAFTIAPGGHVGAHLEGDIDIYIASGGVSANIDLIRVSLPVTATASWGISTVPTDCAAHFGFTMDGKLIFSSGGGEVDLVAKFGICPVCDHESWPIFSWGPLVSKTSTLFTIPDTTFTTPLDPALCFRPLTVSIGKPLNGAVLQSGLPVQAGAVAIRPGATGSPAQNLPCSDITWSATGSADISDGAVGCSPFITFPSSGNFTITANATDSFGETGSASVNVRVLPALAGFRAFITPQPPPGFSFVPILPTESTPFRGSISGGTPPYFYNWAVLDVNNLEVAGQSGSATNATVDAFVLQPIDPAGLHIVFTAEDSTTPTSQVAKATVTIGPLVN